MLVLAKTTTENKANVNFLAKHSVHKYCCSKL